MRGLKRSRLSRSRATDPLPWIADCIPEEGMPRVPHASQIALRFCNSAGRCIDFRGGPIQQFPAPEPQRLATERDQIESALNQSTSDQVWRRTYNRTQPSNGVVPCDRRSFPTGNFI